MIHCHQEKLHQTSDECYKIESLLYHELMNRKQQLMCDSEKLRYVLAHVKMLDALATEVKYSLC